jgi:DNA-binding PadR family transcriptional regulator
MKYPVLGFLVDQPMHGYALKRALSPALPPGQTVNDGILYPLLRRLEEEGLVRKRVERGGGRTRNVFHPTAKGRRAFEAWLHGAADERDEVAYDFLLGHPFLTKCLFFGRLAPEEVHVKLADQLGDCVQKLGTFKAIRERMIGRGVDPYRIAVLDLGIAQQEEKQRWLKRMIKQLEESRAPAAA